MLYEFLPLVAFKLPAHLGMASYTIYANVKLMSSLFSGYGIWLLFPAIPAEDCDLWVYPK